MSALAQSLPDVETPLWQAMADPTRRYLLDRLRGGPLTTSELCLGVPMTRYGVMNHLAVMERAGLISARRHGRQRLNHLNIAPLIALYDNWIAPRAHQLGIGVAAFAQHVARSTAGDSMKQTPNSSANVLHIALDWTLAAARPQAWQCLTTEVQVWWPASHRAGPPDAVMSLDARLGGTLTERAANGGGVEWYRIIALDPGQSIDLAGQLATRYGGPATSLLHLALEDGPTKHTTVLRLTDSIVGRIGPEMHQSVSSGWQAILGGAVAHLQRGA